MRFRTLLVLLVAALLPVAATAARHRSTFSDGAYLVRDNDDDLTDADGNWSDNNGFSWVVVHNHSTTASGWQDWEELHRQRGYDDDRDAFIVRYGDERWRITDRRTVNRAIELIEPIQRMGREARVWARSIKASYRDDRSDDQIDRVRERLERREEALDDAIERRERRGESTYSLERQRDAVQEAIESLGDRHTTRVYRIDKARLENEARAFKSEHRSAIRNVGERLDDLARDAIRHGRAERID